MRGCPKTPFKLFDLCGFTEAEIAAVLERMATEGGFWSVANALNTMRTFYYQESRSIFV